MNEKAASVSVSQLGAASESLGGSVSAAASESVAGSRNRPGPSLFSLYRFVVSSVIAGAACIGPLLQTSTERQLVHRHTVEATRSSRHRRPP